MLCDQLDQSPMAQRLGLSENFNPAMHVYRRGSMSRSCTQVSVSPKQIYPIRTLSCREMLGANENKLFEANNERLGLRKEVSILGRAQSPTDRLYREDSPQDILKKKYKMIYNDGVNVRV